MVLGAPAALWWLILIPLVILLYMLRARREPRMVPSTLLWERAARDLVARMPVRRFERNLLLLLQVLAIALLALALARPSIALHGLSGSGVVLVVDTSASMQATDVPPSRMAAAQQEARALLAGLASRQPVALLAAGARPVLLVELTTDRAALGRALDGLRASDAGDSIAEALALAGSLRAHGRAAVVHLFSDRPPPDSQVRWHRIGRGAPNAAVTAVHARTDALGHTRLLVRVEAFGGSFPDRALVVAVGGQTVARRTLGLVPGTPQTAVFDLGAISGEVAVSLEGHDALAADDRAAAVVGREWLPRVLVAGEDNAVLDAALRAVPLAGVSRTDRVAPSEWGGADVVVLDGVSPIELAPGAYLLIGTVGVNLPVRIEGDATDQVVRTVSATHRVTRMADLRGVRVGRAIALRPQAGTVLAEGDIPLVWAYEGRGIRAVVLPFSLAASDLPSYAAFPVLIANALDWLAGGGLFLAPGAAPVALAGPWRQAWLHDPAGDVRQVLARDGMFMLPPLDRVGAYRLRTNGWERRWVVPAVDRRESELAVAPPPGSTTAASERLPAQLPLARWLLGLAAALIAAEWWLWTRGLPPRPRRRGSLVVLRMGVIALLVMGFAGIEIASAVGDLTVILAADRSDSIGLAGARRMRVFLDEARSRAGPGLRVGLVTFGSDAVLEEAPSEEPRLAMASRPRTDGTNIAAAIQRAIPAFPAGAARRLVLLTDGQANAGDLAPALAELRARGIELVVAPMASDPAPDVLVEEVTVPAQVSVGERVPVTVTLRASAPAEAELRVRANGVLLLAQEMNLRAGRTGVDLEVLAAQPGLLRIDATIEASPDAEPGNNRAFALGLVSGGPSVIYAGTPAGPLAAMLESQRLSVRRLLPAQLPGSAAGYHGTAAVVLDDVPAYVLSPRQMAALRDFVRIGGGGLVAVGGTQSFGIGGYAGTPLEEALPVSMDVRHRLAIPTMAVVLVLDASGSMGGFGNEMAKVELAKETAQSVVDLLGERDVVGVLAFDQAPRWLIQPTAVSQRTHILEAVSRIRAGGGTNLYPALVAARDALRRAEARVKHIIVLSDGQTDPGDFRGLAAALASERITVSTVAIGRDADIQIMRSIAGWGRGRAYVAHDAYSIPRILAAEALLATRSYVVEERFIPRIAGASALVADLGPLPPLLGYLATVPKPSAEVILTSHHDDPILAAWSLGVGRAVAVTTDARSRWTAPWSGWNGAVRFWSQAVRWAMSRQTGSLDVHAETVGERVRVVLDARAADGSPYVGWEAAVTLAGEHGEVGASPLVQTQPGWYEADLPLPQPGGYLVTVAVSEGGRQTGRFALPLAVPYSPELRQVGLNRAVIAHMVEAAGARVVATPTDALAPPLSPERRSRPLWPLFGAMAMAGFAAEVALRRLPAIEQNLGRLAAMAAAGVRKAPGPDDAEYDAADRWRIENEAEAAARAASMDTAARLYIARLRRQRAQGDGPGDHSGDH